MLYKSSSRLYCNHLFKTSQHPQTNFKFFSNSTQLLNVYNRVTVKETESVRELFSDESFKARDSPGRYKIGRVELPHSFKVAALNILKHEDLSSLENEGRVLNEYLRNRQLPVENDEFRAKVNKVEKLVRDESSFIEPFLSEEELSSLHKSQNSLITQRLRKEIYHWTPVDYSKNKLPLQLLVSRFAASYAILCRIFMEISKREPNFQPKTLFDFGAGLAPSIWAANNYWEKSLVEKMCIDSSSEMSDLGELLLKGGNKKNSEPLPGVYFRQFLPASSHKKYEIVVSSFAFMDLPSFQSRIETLDILWKKTSNYLVLVEEGTNSGFEIINEARDYILHKHYDNKKAQNIEDNLSDEEIEMKKVGEGHVFSPCPHEMPCPRYNKDNTPCNFSVKYSPLTPFHKSLTSSTRFSYVVLKKGPISKRYERWARIVREPLLKGGHVICRLCTKDGKLSETTLTKSKNTPKMYACGRKSLLGDLLPVEHEDYVQKHHPKFSKNETDVEVSSSDNVDENNVQLATKN